ncbi:MAG: nucleotidyltransferase substrate binding protein [FCB group bacterium]|nr:nucleotidyltransferase substrate binding protein [FCB group bacterium]
MERVKLKYKAAKDAHKTLEEIIKEPYSKIIRDATIQRFEYTFEAVWKYLKEYLKEQHGIVCNSPKGCFREAFSMGLLTDEQTEVFLKMTDDRNLTSHTYHEELAEAIYGRVKGYAELMAVLVERAHNN